METHMLFLVTTQYVHKQRVLKAVHPSKMAQAIKQYKNDTADINTNSLEETFEHVFNDLTSQSLLS